MQQEQEKPERSQETDLPDQSELSMVWQELLGLQATQPGPTDAQPGDVVISPLSSDPWSELVQARGIEVIDLEQVHLHVSDKDVEEILQVMQEQPAPPSKDQPGKK